jgi:hypothetical protein
MVTRNKVLTSRFIAFNRCAGGRDREATDETTPSPA